MAAVDKSPQFTSNLRCPAADITWHTVYTWWHHTLETETSCVCVLIRHFLCTVKISHQTQQQINLDRTLFSTDAVFCVWYRLIKGRIFTCNFKLSAALTPAAHMERPYWKLHSVAEKHACCQSNTRHTWAEGWVRLFSVFLSRLRLMSREEQK